jgi:uncharacterized Zn-binding protein involved in type VI secretion
VGDKTTHGGTVIGGDPTFDIYGIAVARVGDMTVCPKCKGMFAISSGLEGMTSGGQAPACHMDKTACGARLISSLATAYGEDSVKEAGAPQTDSATAYGEDSVKEAGAPLTNTSVAVTPTICLDCLAKAAAAGSAMVVRE